MRSLARLALASGLSLLVSLPALAGGPGTYKVKGYEPSGNQYTGTVNVTQTGKDTWKIVWKIGSQTWIGYGVGNTQVMAITFSSGGKSGSMLLAEADNKTDYNGVWAMNGDQTASAEEWIAAQ